MQRSARESSPWVEYSSLVPGMCAIPLSTLMPISIPLSCACAAAPPPRSQVPQRRRRRRRRQQQQQQQQRYEGGRARDLLNERLAVGRDGSDRLVEADHSRHILLDIGRREEHLSVPAQARRLSECARRHAARHAAPAQRRRAWCAAGRRVGGSLDAVFLSVFDVDSREPLPDRAGALVGREDAFAGGRQSILPGFILEGLCLYEKGAQVRVIAAGLGSG